MVSAMACSISTFLPGVFVGGELVAGKKGKERRHQGRVVQSWVKITRG